MKSTLKIKVSILLFQLLFVQLFAQNSSNTTIETAKIQKDSLIQTKAFQLSKRYINIPLSRNDSIPKREITIKVDGKLLAFYTARITTQNIDYWGYIDLQAYKNKEISLSVKGLDGKIDRLKQENEIKNATVLFTEKYRPQLHFTTKRGRFNDPNGLVYYDGMYHMYYQYNPLGMKWGNISWGHAVSKDLTYWEELSPVLFPNEKGMPFTGAAFIDQENLLNLKENENDPLIMFYLRTKSGLHYSYSTDGGKTLKEYAGNPVLTHKGARIDSPKPSFYEPTKRWIAPTFDHYTHKNGEIKKTVGIYSSADLKNWQLESNYGNIGMKAECPDLFQLPIDGDKNNKKWVMVLGDGAYFLGDFDGKTMYAQGGNKITEKDKLKVVYQGCHYAPQTWHNAPDDRRIQIAWMPMQHYPKMAFSQQMSVPLELKLKTTKEGVRMFSYPPKEFNYQRKIAHEFKNTKLTPKKNILEKIKGLKAYDMEIVLKESNAKTIIKSQGATMVYDGKKNEFNFAGHSVKILPQKGLVHIRVIADLMSVEVFVNKGQAYLPIENLPPDDFTISVKSENGTVPVKSLAIYQSTPVGIR